MDIEKDYYSILGVSPTADIIVIRAAYKALVKVFHPDKYTGSAEDAHNKTVQLNEAFEILSNTSTRKKYDDERANNAYKEQATEDSEQQESVKDSLKADWDLACKYKPKLSNIYKNLDKLSAKLSFSFQVLILESKQFDNASAIAKDMEITYLDNYFGPNKTIMEFAKKLLLDGYLAAAKDLNRVVKLLGKSAEANVIISQIESEYRLYSRSEEAIREKLRKEKLRRGKIEQQREEERENLIAKIQATNQTSSSSNQPQPHSIFILILLPLIFLGGWYISDGRHEQEQAKSTVQYDRSTETDTYTLANDDNYKGDVVDGSVTGKGKYTWPNGDIYEGDFVDGSRTGKGKFTWPSGHIYKGDIVDGSHTGKGKYTWPGGHIYEGDFVDGSRTGQGRYTSTNGNIYEGDVEDGSRTGKGKYTSTKGHIYEGDFVYGIQTGKGKFTWPNGDIYEGDWVNDRATGKGRFSWVNGESYIGEVINGVENGRGIGISKGNVRAGVWSNGKFLHEKDVRLEEFQ